MEHFYANKNILCTKHRRKHSISLQKQLTYINQMLVSYNDAQHTTNNKVHRNQGFIIPFILTTTIIIIIKHKKHNILKFPPKAYYKLQNTHLCLFSLYNVLLEKIGQVNYVAFFTVFVFIT